MSIPFKWTGTRIISGADWNDMRLWAPADYVVFTENSIYYAFGKFSGSIDYTGSTFSTVINNAISDLKSGSIWVMGGNYTLTNTIYITGSADGSDNSAISLIFSPGVNIEFTGTTTAIQMGNTTTEMKRCGIYGNGARIYRSNVGGTGSHLMNCHLCTVDNIRIDALDVALLLEGSWGTQVKRCELNGSSPTGSFGMRLINTRTGTYANAQCNLMVFENDWFKGSVAAVHIWANSGTFYQHEDIVFKCCDFNNSPVGINFESAYGATVESCYFESNTGYDMVMGTGSVQVADINIRNNFMSLDAGITGSYIGNTDGVTFAGNLVDGGANSIFIWVSGSTNKRVYAPWPNRVTTATEFTGSDGAGTGSQMFYVTPLNVDKFIHINNRYLKWRDVNTIERDIIGYTWDNKIVLKNPLTGSTSNASIEIGTETSGGEIRLYDWGASKPMGYFHNSWFLPPYTSSDPNTGSWGDNEAGRMWYNTTADKLRYYDGSKIHEVISAQGITSAATNITKITGAMWCYGAIYPVPSETLNIGSAVSKWSSIYVQTVYEGDSVFSNGWRLTEDGDTMVLKRKDGTVAQRWE